MKPAARSLERLREEGYLADVVERNIPNSGARQEADANASAWRPRGTTKDLYGIADIEAMTPDHTLYVQACPASTLSAHIRKCLSTERPVRMVKGKPVEELSNYEKLRMLIACSARVFEVWAWIKHKVEGSRRLWHVRRHRAVMDGESVVFVLVAAPTPQSEETPIRAKRRRKQAAGQAALGWSEGEGQEQGSENRVKTPVGSARGTR